MPTIDFEHAFTALTANPPFRGNPPFPWQRALYDDWFSIGKFPTACNLPTGLGKTSVIAVWLIALANNPTKVPRRLVYVVNRRTVVDQTTDEVEKYRKNSAAAGLTEPLAISTLRGQFADNREWSADPSRPAVICGTVDMIGSRLLFSGYGCGFKSKPLHAGFLGQDVLLVHDEAHLEPAFQKLLMAIQKEQSRCAEFLSFNVIALSATSRGTENASEPTGLGDIFQLTEAERSPPDVLPEATNDPLHIVWRRLKAKKALRFIAATQDTVARRIGELARRWKSSNKAILIFVRNLKDVQTVQQMLTDEKEGVPTTQVQILTGTLRGLERDRLAAEDGVFARFLPQPRATPQPGTVYLICTSAGEVGVDISADHMVCDLTTLDSMMQRLGRVNRRGGGAAEIDVVHESDPEATTMASEYDKARAKTLEILQKWLPQSGRSDTIELDRRDASPFALRNLALAITDDERGAAFAPTPAIPPVTDILFDSWSFTTIREKIPGRPDVGPYLHGVAHELPQTAIAWRNELDLLANEANPRRQLQAIFAKHRIRPHETVTTASFHVVEFLKTVAKKRERIRDTRVAILFSSRLELSTIGELIDKPGPLQADPILVLPASFGYLDENGMLSLEAFPVGATSETMPRMLDIADHAGYEATPNALARCRVIVERSDGGWRALRRLDGQPLPDSIASNYPKSTGLIDDLREPGFRVRLVQPIQLGDEGEPVTMLVALAPVRQRPPRAEQTLDEHVKAVECAAKLIAEKLKLREPFRAALLFAAQWHDEGKKAGIWQRYIGGKDGQPPLGKSAKWCDPKKLGGYRHEFGSLLRIANCGRHQTACVQPDELEVKDLALHLIAAHHGNCRPHFSNAFDRDFSTQQSEQIHMEAIHRFARLQRQYGRWGLAYLESLLRAADAAASAGLETDDDAEDINDGDE
jgi:CRISPR-associated endonuclease/helicase Cas3